MNSELAKVCDVRGAAPSDVSFILATFLRGVYYSDPYISFIPKPIFMAEYAKIAKAIILSPNTIINIACLKSDPDTIVGYSILSNDYHTIHWVYVKKRWREQGIAKALLPKYPTATTHITPIGKSLMSKFENLVFNPFLL